MQTSTGEFLKIIFKFSQNLKTNAHLIFPSNNVKGDKKLYAHAEMNSVEGKIQIKFSARKMWARAFSGVSTNLLPPIY